MIGASATPIKVVLIGFGRMGRNHFRVLSEDSRFSIVGVIDPVFANEVPAILRNVKTASSFDKAADFESDCAVVATPTSTHLKVGMDMLKAGKHVLIEKPLCASTSECRSIISFARERKLSLSVGHVERFNPAVRKLREVIESGAIGAPIHFSFTRIGGYPSNVGEDNNVLLDLAVHDLDVLCFLAGPMSVRSGICHSTWKPGVYDTAEILLSGASNVSASIHVNWITPVKIRTIRVTGAKGVCFVDYMLQTCTLLGGNLLNARVEPQCDFASLVEAYRNGDKVEFGVSKEEPLKLQLNALHRVLTGQESDICQCEEAALAVQLAERAIAISSGK